jgi:diguanylate cyclase (GGDEF)-like protein/PAS domain S-box-containing protein
MADAERTEPKDPRRPARERAQLAQLRERVWSGFASEDVDLVSIVEPLSEVLAGEVFVVSDLRRIGSPLVHVEPGFERLTGYAPQVALGRELGFLLRNDTDQEAVREAREAVREGNAIGVTLRNYRADGSLFWCEQRHHPVRDERGRIAHLVTVLRDVTDQVHAYGAEQVEREQSAAGVGGAPWFAYGAMFDAHGEFRLSWVSGDTVAVLGRDRAEVMRDGWVAMIEPETRAVIAERGAALRDAGGSRRDRYRVRLAGGDERTVEDAVSVSWVASEARLFAVHGTVRVVEPSRSSVRAALAGVDRTTGLPTEELLADRLMLATRRAQRQGGRVALVALSLDHFAFVETHLDAQRGERLERETAQRLRRALRRSDTLVRAGRGEFMVLLEDLPDADAALPVVDKLLAWVSRPFDDGQLRVELSASAGVAVADGPLRIDALRDEAVGALARARAPGRARSDGGGGFAFADLALDERLRARRAFELELRGAFAADQWRLHYQPRFRLAGDEVTGFEALVRWQHPERGLLLPADFLGELERLHMGGELFEHVLPLALRRAAARARVGRATRVAVNVGVAQLDRDDLVPFVLRSLERAGVPPAMLELELHAGSDASALERSAPRLAALRAHGVRLALDDFGVGDTNLARLRELPIDVLKIDRSFVQRLGGRSEPADLELLRAMVAIGRGLGLTVVAEGIETEEQRSRLRAIACDEGQGYLLAPPAADVDLG